MADYITQAQLTQLMDAKTIKNLTDDAKIGSPDAAIITFIIENSTGLINSYLQGTWNINDLDSSITTMLRNIAGEICRFGIWQRRGRVPDNVQRSYDNAIDRLEKLSRAEIQLGSTENTEIQNEVSLTTDSKGDSIREFTDNNLSNF